MLKMTDNYLCSSNCGLLGCDIVYPCRWILTFWRTLTMKIETACSCEMSVSTYKTTIGTVTIVKISEPLVVRKHPQKCI